MPNRCDTTVKKNKNWPPAGKFFLQLGIAFFLILFAPSGGRLVGPLLLLLFWIVATAENRTITISTIIAAGTLGLVGFIPMAVILETPIVLVFGKGELLTAVFSMLLEIILIVAVVAGLCLWPKSRLRYSASILDFVMIGLGLGVGLECGIGILHASSVGFQGVALGLFPQLPGMWGHSKLPVACSSPAVWGMSFGLLVGVARYLVGPDFNTSGLRRGVVIAIAVLLLLWQIGERVGYIREPSEGFWHVLFWLDLKGRLLAYLTGLLTMTAVLVEWLLLQQTAGLKNPLRAWRLAWLSNEKQSWFERLLAVLRLWEKRALIREKILVEEVKPVLLPPDLKRAKQRILKTEQMLAKEGN
ncbi:hypothetical protein KAR34_01835 [bacterium]|nr:hypothetical protein [bacterium]